jgi:hypothetical protein
MQRRHGYAELSDIYLGAEKVFSRSFLSFWSAHVFFSCMNPRLVFHDTRAGLNKKSTAFLSQHNSDSAIQLAFSQRKTSRR